MQHIHVAPIVENNNMLLLICFRKDTRVVGGADFSVVPVTHLFISIVFITSNPQCKPVMPK